MLLEYINEAFKSLEQLNEEMFNIDSEGISNLSDFMDNDDDNEISIIDMSAEDEDDLEDSYVGKIIVDCNICHSHIFKDASDLHIDADGVVDPEVDCPYCGEQGGYIIVGQITEYDPTATDTEVSETETSEEVNEPTDSSDIDEVDEISEEEVSEEDTSIDESLNEGSRKFKPHTLKLLKLIGSDLAAEETLDEAFNNVSIETEDQKMTMTSDDSGKVTVTTEPTEPADMAVDNNAEVIAPVSVEAKDEIINAADIDGNSEEDPIIDAPADDASAEEFADFDIDEFDEESMDELGESYLKRVYENVDSFKTSNISTTSNKLIIEGVINFKSGSSKKTGFIFESADATADGKVRFIGENTQLSRGKKSFTLNGTLNNKRLVMESFTYNYRAKDNNGKSTRVYGTISRNK